MPLDCNPARARHPGPEPSRPVTDVQSFECRLHETPPHGIATAASATAQLHARVHLTPVIARLSRARPASFTRITLEVTRPSTSAWRAPFRARAVLACVAHRTRL